MKKNSFDIVAVVHRLWIDGHRKTGGLDIYLNYCSSQGKRILLIEHPLTGLKENISSGDNRTHISIIEKGKTIPITQINLHHSSNTLSWICEIFLNFMYISTHVNKGATFFASDVLNAFSGVLLVHHFRRTYLHCVDYSENRFSHKILNYIYSVLFKIAFRFYDVIGVVSQKTKEKFILDGCPESKLIYVPNSQNFVKKNLSKKESYSLLSMGGTVSEKYRYMDIIEIIRELKRWYPNVKLYIAGGIEQDRVYVNKLKAKIRNFHLSKNVKFCGFLNREDLEKILNRSMIGLSFYSRSVEYYMKYADPLKIREYALYGIPTVSDGRTSIENELVGEGVGVTVKNKQQSVLVIRRLFDDNLLYKQYQRKCIEWSKRNDKKIIFTNLTNKIFNDNR